jgi:hypothetical protein
MLSSMDVGCHDSILGSKGVDWPVSKGVVAVISRGWSRDP